MPLRPRHFRPRQYRAALGLNIYPGLLHLAAKFTFLVHSHMLRHACGFKLANDDVDTRALQAYLGHKSIQHTVRYTELAPTRFKGFWRY